MTDNQTVIAVFTDHQGAQASVRKPADVDIDIYEIAIKADSFLVTAHGPAEEMARARAVLGTLGATRVSPVLARSFASMKN